MKNLSVILFGFGLLFGLSSLAQGQTPDQNPNHQISADKYAQQSENLLKKQGETIQATYKAYDWTENKQAQKQARIDRNHQLRMERARFIGYYTPYRQCNLNNRYYLGYNNYYCRANTYQNMLIGARIYHLAH